MVVWSWEEDQVGEVSHEDTDPLECIESVIKEGSMGMDL